MYYYVVVEYSYQFRGSYPEIYNTYEQALVAVQAKHKELLDWKLEEALAAGDESIESEVDIPENPSGRTDLYIEKEISIEVYRLPVASTPNVAGKSSTP